MDVVLGVAALVLGVLYWNAQRRADAEQRRANDLAAELAEIEFERRAKEVKKENSLPAADLEIYRASFGNLQVINNGPGPATSVSVKFAGEPDAILVGGSASGAMSLTDLKSGQQTRIVIRSTTSVDDRIKFTLYWDDPRGHHTKEIDCQFGELPADPSQRRGISRPSRSAGGRSLRPRPKPHGI